MAHREPRIRLRRNQYLRYCEAAGWTTQADQARVFGRSEPYISRIVNDDSKNVGSDFVAAVLWALPDRKFEELFEVAPHAAAARHSTRPPELPTDIAALLLKIKDGGDRDRLDAFLRLLQERGWAMTRCGEVLGVSREMVRQRIMRAKPVQGLPRVPQAPRLARQVAADADEDDRPRRKAVAA